MSALRERLDLGFVIASRTEVVEEVAAGLIELTGMERVAFLNTGTEAVMTALRIARTATGRDDIVVFSTAYHGHADSVLAAASSENGVRHPADHLGHPARAVENVYVWSPGTTTPWSSSTSTVRRLAAVHDRAGDPATPGVQNPDSCAGFGRSPGGTARSSIFDEMVHRFSCHPAGVQGLYGIEADSGHVRQDHRRRHADRRDRRPRGIMDTIDGGVWDFGDDSRPTAESTFFAGTFSQHPMTMVRPGRSGPPSRRGPGPAAGPRSQDRGVRRPAERRLP